MSRQRARMLIEEARVVSEQDLVSAVQMLEEAYSLDPDPELMNEILLRKDALGKLDQARERFWNRYRDNRLYSAYQILLGLPDNYRFDQEDEILADLRKKFSEAEDLVKQAKALPALEHRKALGMFRRAAELMPDFPGLEAEIAAIERIAEQGNAYLIAITRAIEKGEISKASSLLRRYRDGYGDDDNARLLEKQILRRAGDMQRGVRLRRVAAAVVLVLAVLLAAAGAVVFHDYRTLEKAEALWRQIKNDRAAGRFDAAVRKAGEVIDLAGRVYLLELDRRGLLEMQARRFIDSRHSREGVAGRLLVDGKYVAKDAASASRELDRRLIAAEEAMSLGDPGAAVAHYEKALALAVRIGDGEREKTVRDGLVRARGALVRVRMDEIAARDAADSEAALAAYRDLEKEVKRYGLAGSPVGRRLDRAIAAAARAGLRRMESAAKQAYAAGDFAAAARLWREAADFAAANDAAGPERLAALEADVARALVASVVGKADEMRRNGRLADALAGYRKAVELGRGRGLAGFAPFVEAERRAGELALAIDEGFVKKRLAEARKALDDEDLARARGALAAAKQRLAASDFAAAGAMDGLSRQIASMEQELSAREQVAGEREYLERNYAAVIRKAFGLPRDSALLNPEIVVVGDEDGRRVWSITAYSYEKQGDEESYIAYHVSYAKDLAGGGWRVESSDREVRGVPGGG